MQKLAEICIRRPVFASMIVLSLVVVGAASYFRLGVDRFPAVDLPTVSVRTELPGASVEEMETQVSQKLEEAVNTVQGISQLWSITTGSPRLRPSTISTRSFSRRPVTTRRSWALPSRTVSTFSMPAKTTMDDVGTKIAG